MDYYGGSSGRGRSSYRGSSYRGSRGESSFRGSRGSSRGYSSRGRGGGSSSFYSNKYETSSPARYGSSESKYNSSGGRFDDGYSRRSDAPYSIRDHRSELSDMASRKRIRTDSYSPSQGSFTRRAQDEEDYRSSARYSESRSYDESRVFKKPRPTEYKSPREDFRAKEPIRARSSRGRIVSRGRTSSRGFTRRGRESFGSRRRGVTHRTTTASTSEILAIRRAKLLQERQKNQSQDTEEKNEKKLEDAGEDKKDEVAETTEDASKEPVAKEERTDYYGKAFIKLDCPHCSAKCVTFKEYISHLQRPAHMQAMKAKVDELKSTLATMRIAQREKQKVADEEDLTSMNTRSHFCAICKLNYSQDKDVHQASELHKKLKMFLLPFCRICRHSCQNAMSYEIHLSSLSHLRRKHAQEEREKRSGVDILDKFMVLDSVGSGDEPDVDEPEGAEAKQPEPETKEEDLTLGVEFIRSVKVLYCEVCRTYLPRSKDEDHVLKRHCRTKEHLRCYLHYGNEALLEKMNESEGSEKKEKEPAKKDSATKEGEDEIMDGDKLWDDVGELLNETQPREKSDDEDEEEGGRFDRFKSKEKHENGDIADSTNVLDEAAKVGKVEAIAAVDTA